ncbi:hypothetical protein BDR26DRAFT_935933 [Obelidium mucronatum]|nr:hypothetical protein BDR26DRAFT_935933 [Obelidium mucronatum]
MSDPFSILISGAPKSGKTHTLSILLESCLLPTWNESHHHPDSEIINTLNPMCALILHYSESPFSICPFVNLCIPITHVSLHHQSGERREVYKSKCEARPLLFSWAKLTARHVKILLHLDDGGCGGGGGGGGGGDGEVAILRDLLTSYQQPFQEDGESEDDEKPLFQDFLIQVRTRIDEFRKRDTTGINNSHSNDDALAQQQQQPPSSQEPSSSSNNNYNNNILVSQKLNILETFIAESPRNRFRHPTDFAKLIKRGILVIADLTDLKVQASANHWALTEFDDVGQVVEGVFTVLLDMFGKGGGGLGGGGSVCKKVVVVDDMDLYSKQQQQRGTRGSSSCEGIMMRKLIGNMQKPGVNVLMAASDPRIFSPECLQLASLVVMHRMGSRLWFDYLKESGGVPLRERDFFGDEHDTDENGVVGLGLGDALIYAGSHGLTKRKGSSCWKLEVRVKMTEYRRRRQNPREMIPSSLLLRLATMVLFTSTIAFPIQGENCVTSCTLKCPPHFSCVLEQQKSYTACQIQKCKPLEGGLSKFADTAAAAADGDGVDGTDFSDTIRNPSVNFCRSAFTEGPFHPDGTCGGEKCVKGQICGLKHVGPSCWVPTCVDNPADPNAPKNPPSNFANADGSSSSTGSSSDSCVKDIPDDCTCFGGLTCTVVRGKGFYGNCWMADCS